MADIFSELLNRLVQAGLSKDEAAVYVQLTKGPSTHLKLSRETGISRTKVYRIAANLEKQGIVNRRADDRGKFLVAGDLGVLNEEAKRRAAHAVAQLQAFEQIASILPKLQTAVANDFVVHTYSGVEGMRQMQWHELKTKTELLALGYVTFEELTGSRRWAEDFRRRVAAAGYRTREIISRPPNEPVEAHFTAVESYAARYTARRLAGDILPVHAPIVTYNDTVAIYQVDSERAFGIEIIHAGFAETIARIFEHYWSIAEDTNWPPGAV